MWCVLVPRRVREAVKLILFMLQQYRAPLTFQGLSINQSAAYLPTLPFEE